MNEATEAVLDFVLAAEAERFPEEVVREGKRCLVDGIAVILAGSTTPAGVIVQQRIRALAAAGEASVLCAESLRAPASLAALANGLAGHAMDYDDTQLSRYPDRIFGLLTHPTIPVLSASLAVAERLDAPGLKFLAAFLTGFEVECKVAEAISPEHYRRGFHSSGTIGAVGAAVAAAKLLELERRELAMALGIVASFASGIRANFGTMTKPLHVGRAAENGVVAAELAARGFTADAHVLDGPWGFFQVLGGGFDAEKLAGRLGAPYSIVDPGVSVKPYACGSLGHPSMDAMLALVLEHDVTPEEVERIRLRAGSNILNPLRYRQPMNELEAKFSIPFMLSAILLRRRAGIDEFTDEFVRSEPVQAMMERVETVHDAEVEALGYEKMRSVVEVHLKDGRRLERRAEVYRGGPERPLTREELHGKFMECAALVLPEERAAAALEAVESVEKLASVRELVGALLPEPAEVEETRAAFP